MWPLKNVPQENKKVQTNVMEMLGVDDLVEDSQSKASVVDEGYFTTDFDGRGQARNLINGAIAGIGSGMDSDYASNDRLIRRGSHPDAEIYGS